ncbi:MAG: hypothetical protein U0640_01500 [Phycisphaerales bacterium]
MRDIAIHILRKVLIMLALIVACAAYTVAAFADGGTPPLRGGPTTQDVVQQPVQTTPSIGPTQTAKPETHSANVQRSNTEALPLGKKPAPATKTADRSEKLLAPSSIGRTVLALGSVLALIGVLAVGASVLRRKAQKSGKWPLLSAMNFAGAPSPSGVLEILAKFPVGSGTNLLLLKLDRRVLLISQSANKGLRSGSTLSTLCELTEPDDVASLLMKIRGEEQSRLAAKFESILAREEEITDQALSDVEEEPVRTAAGRSARHVVSSPKTRAIGATLEVPSDGVLSTDHAKRVVGGTSMQVGTTRTGREALAAIQARMAKPTTDKQTATRETPRARSSAADGAKVEPVRENGRGRSVLNANGSGGLLA